MNTRLTLAALLVAGLTPSMGLAIELIQQGTFVDFRRFRNPIRPELAGSARYRQRAGRGLWWSANDRNGDWVQLFHGTSEPIGISGKPHKATLKTTASSPSLMGRYPRQQCRSRTGALRSPRTRSGITVSFDMFINDYSGKGPEAGMSSASTAQTSIK
jgi:hypothetical protein